MDLDLRAIALRATEWTGANALIHQTNAGKLAIFCYHGVVNRRFSRHEANSQTTVSVEDFAEHLEFLGRWFRPVTLSAVRDWLVEGKPLPRHAALITFDDGYRNVFTHGAPVLQRYGIPAAVFLSSAFIGGERLYWYDEVWQRLNYWSEDAIELPGKAGARVAVAWPKAEVERQEICRKVRNGCKRIPDTDRIQYVEYIRAHTAGYGSLSAEQHHVLDPMNWDEARRLTSMGFEIGSHTVNHPILTNLEPAELVRELAESKAEIEREISRPCYSIAYPNGTRADYSPAVEAAVKAAGYEIGFTMVDGMNGTGTDPLGIKRIAVPGHAPPIALRIRASGLHAMLGGGG
jgi:peptidoglycan/xylan/chitin deacetylase (PgdA/CDA1 family)